MGRYTFVLAVFVFLCSTKFHVRFPCAVLSRLMSAQKKAKKKLLQSACHVFTKKGCQAACLVCNGQCAMRNGAAFGEPVY